MNVEKVGSCPTRHMVFFWLFCCLNIEINVSTEPPYIFFSNFITESHFPFSAASSVVVLARNAVDEIKKLSDQILNQLN